ncbi:MAG: hypothetical protein Q8O72_14985 [Bacteroidales bacterium]|nr:hypothetical protein [Bacteroidales bacterium]
MKKIKNITLASLITLISISSFAQGGGVWNFDWGMAFPMGSTTDFVNQPSFRGVSIEGRGYVTDQITVGGIAGWNVFYENNSWTQTSTSETGTIYGYQRRYLNVMPLMVNAHYYFSQGTFMPYIGAGLGTYYIESRDFMGIYYSQGKDWHFGVAPEAGLIMYLGSSSNTGINLNFKYNMAAKTKDQPTYSWLGINIGLSYLF